MPRVTEASLWIKRWSLAAREAVDFGRPLARERGARALGRLQRQQEAPCVLCQALQILGGFFGL
eukprot:3810355-Pyramimonas_sp.AAC.1